MKRLALAALLASSLPLTACVADTDGEEVVDQSEDELRQKADEHWFYTGKLPRLDDAKVTVSLAGNTAHVIGFLPASRAVPALPHLKTTIEGGRRRVDLVYPIATAASAGDNSGPGTYAFHRAVPFRPDGMVVSISNPTPHFVTWGGFPFLAYNGGIAFHGPITPIDNKAAGSLSVWYLRRGDVSGGCNRMLGEHVVELAHVLGVPMRRVYERNKSYDPQERPMDVEASVKVISDYDTYGGKFIDVDYATDVGVTRPAKVHGANEVVMFGSWIASETPGGKDLPPDMKWEGGVDGKPYVFKDHVLPNTVCSMPRSVLPALKQLAGADGLVPPQLCAKKACIVKALKNGGAAAARRDCAVE